jgi:hypothetical protein
LAGRPVHAGDVLELAVFPGAAVADTPSAAVWLRVTYSWAFDPNRAPLLSFELGDGEREPRCVGLAKFEPPPGAVLRWPSDP